MVKSVWLSVSLALACSSGTGAPPSSAARGDASLLNDGGAGETKNCSSFAPYILCEDFEALSPKPWTEMPSTSVARKPVSPGYGSATASELTVQGVDAGAGGGYYAAELSGALAQGAVRLEFDLRVDELSASAGDSIQLVSWRTGGIDFTLTATRFDASGYKVGSSFEARYDGGIGASGDVGLATVIPVGQWVHVTASTLAWQQGRTGFAFSVDRATGSASGLVAFPPSVVSIGIGFAAKQTGRVTLDNIVLRVD
jgi:hypothetical protein